MKKPIDTEKGATSGLARSLFALWDNTNRRRRKQFVVLIVMSIFASILEVVSLGLLVPFLALLAAPLGGSQHPTIQTLMNVSGLHNPAALAVVALVAFSVAAVVSGAFRLFVLYANNRFSFSLATEIGQEIYKKALYQPYVAHLSSNSSLLVDAAANKSTMVAANVVGQILSLSTSIFVGSGIILTIMVANTQVAAIVAGLFAVLYGVVIATTRAGLRRNGLIARKKSAEAIKVLQEGIGGIRDVIIDGSQQAYVDVFREADRPYKTALSRNAVMAGSPRFLVETAGMVLIAVVGFVFSRQGSIAEAIPTLGILALGAQRLLPMLQQAYAAIATIRGNEPILEEVVTYLTRPVPVESGPTTSLSFDAAIELRNVSFAYPTSRRTNLTGINMVLPKGARIGFFGATGSGKSTILDLIMGLLEPTSGSILVDGQPIDAVHQQAWRRHISHVPQTIFLSDSTIAENIAFGLPAADIDMDRVRWAAQQAQLHSVVASFPQGYLTTVGERGVRLSGGQRQRIGLARALYKRTSVIVLDEATSALDTETERAVTNAIERLPDRPTMIIVAHRLTTLQNCDTLYEVSNGRIVRSGSYSELDFANG